MRVTNYEVLLNEDRIPHLVKESARNYAGNSCLTNPSQIAEFMRELIDISNTKKVKEGAELLTIELFDHIIVGADTNYCSLREQGNI